MNKENKLNQLISAGVVAVIRKPEEDQVEKIAKALVDGGITALELTVDSPRAFEWIRKIKETYGDRVMVGAGTVLDAGAAKRAIDSGAEFILSPHLDEETIKVTVEQGALSIPGVMTPTEMVKAEKAGADLVKIFPANSLGVNYIKELQGPLGHIKIIPTGGVSLDNVEAFIKNGAVAVGVGGSLVNKKAISSGEYDVITDLAKKFVSKVKKAKEEAL